MTEDRFPNWTKLSNGYLATMPVSGWEMGALPMNVLLRFELMDQGDEMRSVQMHIPATRARELAEGLLRTAEQALATTGQPQA